MNTAIHLKAKTKFPEGFMWGAACCAHQVAGSLIDGKPVGNWATFESSKARMDELRSFKVPENKLGDFICGKACEFEKRFRNDFKLAKRLGHNTIRLSVNWAIVEPSPGKFNYEALRNYREMMKAARAIGLTVVLTLYHWTHPSWFEEAGGWTQDNAAEQFNRFVEVVLRYVGPVKFFTVLNEMNVYVMFSYLFSDQWPPRAGSPVAHAKAFEQLVEAQHLAYKSIKKKLPKAMVGVAMAINWNVSDDPATKEREDRNWNDYIFAMRKNNSIDFIGVQTYMHSFFDSTGKNNRFGWDGHDPCTDHPVQSDMHGAHNHHWGMCPEAIYHSVKETWQTHGLPLMVTEHGHSVTEMVDHKRCWYLWESVGWLERLIEEGVPLIGYLHWSILDNFEWLYGFQSKFGLIHVDLKTQKRTPRKSAYLYRSIIRHRGRTTKTAYRYRDLIKHPHGARAHHARAA